MPKLRDNNELARKPKYPIGWVRKMIEGVHTAPEWQAMVRQLPPRDQINFLLACQPKVVENKGETGITVTFKLNGVRENVALPGTVVKAIGTTTCSNDDSDEG